MPEQPQTRRPWFDALMAAYIPYLQGLVLFLVQLVNHVLDLLLVFLNHRLLVEELLVLRLGLLDHIHYLLVDLTRSDKTGPDQTRQNARNGQTRGETNQSRDQEKKVERG